MDVDVELATLHMQVQPCPVPFKEGEGAASPPSAVAPPPSSQLLGHPAVDSTMLLVLSASGYLVKHASVDKVALVLAPEESLAASVVRCQPVRKAAVVATASLAVSLLSTCSFVFANTVLVPYRNLQLWRKRA